MKFPLKNGILGVVGAVVFATAAPVNAASFYECDTDSKEAMNWVSPKIGFIFDDAGKVSVIDGIIQTYFETPIAAKARKRGDKVRITWRIANAIDAAGERIPTFSYVANLNLVSKTVHVIAKPVGFPQRFAGKGTCKIHNK